MPPQRTIPLSQKPLKTERTHEENQERYANIFIKGRCCNPKTYCSVERILQLLEEATEV